MLILVIIYIDHISKHSPGRYLHETLFFTETNPNDITLSRFPYFKLGSRICGSRDMRYWKYVLIELEWAFEGTILGAGIACRLKTMLELREYGCIEKLSQCAIGS